MTTMRRKFVGLFVLLWATSAFLSGLSASASSGTSTVVLVAHPDVAVDTYAVDDIRLFYLGKKSRWPDGNSVRPAVIKTGPVQEAFLEEVMDRTPAKFNSYWKQLVFTGKGIPPKSFPTEETLLEYVRSTPGAVGYIANTTAAEGVTRLVLD